MLGCFGSILTARKKGKPCEACSHFPECQEEAMRRVKDIFGEDTATLPMDGISKGKKK
ncbi:hypothetical protein [Photobacterium ganghwense]|uniref:hypothetical protein n=1 Tax=Photobacterium ganghwense TaxID=320778 RepID=UPI000A743638|nr:hypothetical protein [Photobacterium ganghwense]QSV17122.1 hypothetical protein FH974_19485 [Photobacterium ganghwense]